MAKPNRLSSSGRCARKSRVVTWPTRKETGISTTVMVFIFVFWRRSSSLPWSISYCPRSACALIFGAGKVRGWPKWYVIVHVYSGFEKKRGTGDPEQARKQGPVEDLVEEILVPTEEVVEMRRGQKVNSERKFFPGYVLVKMELTDETWHLVKNTPKVTGFPRAQGQADPITDKEAQRIHEAGRRRSGRTAQVVDHLRYRRAGARLRRSVHLVQRLWSRRSTRRKAA